MTLIVDRITIRRWALALGILVLSIIAHGSSLGNGFKDIDDIQTIVYNDQIEDLRNIPLFFGQSFFGQNRYYRPLVMTSFALNYAAGGRDAFFYNLTNIFLHALNALIVFWLISRITADEMIAAMTAFLFAVHPVHWEAVSNVAGRPELLGALFYFLTLLWFLKQKYVLALLSFGLGLLSKESVVTVLIPLIYWESALRYRQVKSSKQNMGRSYWPLLGFAVVLLAYLLVRWILGIVQTAPRQGSSAFFAGIATFFNGAWEYVRVIVWPFDLRFDRSLRIILSWREAVPGFVMISLLSGFVIFVFPRLDRARKFLCVWLVGAMAIYAQVVPLIAYKGHISLMEHFLYVPSVPLFALLMGGLSSAFDTAVLRWRIAPKMGAVLFGIFILFFASVTFHQEKFYSDPIRMFQQTLYYEPGQTRVRYAFGLALSNRGAFAEAEKHFRQVLAEDDRHPGVRIALGVVLCQQKKYWDAIEILEFAETLTEGDKLIKEQKLQEAFEAVTRQWKELLKKNPENPQIYFSLGVAYSKWKKIDEAIDFYEKAIALWGDGLQCDAESIGAETCGQINALRNCAVMWQIKGDEGKARNYFQKVIELTNSQ